MSKIPLSWYWQVPLLFSHNARIYSRIYILSSTTTAWRWQPEINILFALATCFCLWQLTIAVLPHLHVRFCFIIISLLRQYTERSCARSILENNVHFWITETFTFLGVRDSRGREIVNGRYRLPKIHNLLIQESWFLHQNIDYTVSPQEVYFGNWFSCLSLLSKLLSSFQYIGCF